MVVLWVVLLALLRADKRVEETAAWKAAEKDPNLVDCWAVSLADTLVDTLAEWMVVLTVG